MKHSEEHYTLYFGKQADYYLDVVKDLDSGKKAIFNSSSFLFGILWMFYRKLYIPILVLFVVMFLESMIEQLIFTFVGTSSNIETLVEIIAQISWVIIVGTFANTIYIKQANRKISKILALNLAEEETNLKIKKQEVQHSFPISFW